jgi:hypothetical protein
MTTLQEELIQILKHNSKKFKKHKREELNTELEKINHESPESSISIFDVQESIIKGKNSENKSGGDSIDKIPENIILSGGGFPDSGYVGGLIQNQTPNIVGGNVTSLTENIVEQHHNEHTKYEDTAIIEGITHTLNTQFKGAGAQSEDSEVNTSEDSESEEESEAESESEHEILECINQVYEDHQSDDSEVSYDEYEYEYIEEVPSQHNSESIHLTETLTLKPQREEVEEVGEVENSDEEEEETPEEENIEYQPEEEVYENPETNEEDEVTTQQTEDNDLTVEIETQDSDSSEDDSNKTFEEEHRGLLTGGSLFSVPRVKVINAYPYILRTNS